MFAISSIYQSLFSEYQLPKSDKSSFLHLLQKGYIVKQRKKNEKRTNEAIKYLFIWIKCDQTAGIFHLKDSNMVTLND